MAIKPQYIDTPFKTVTFKLRGTKYNFAYHKTDYVTFNIANHMSVNQ